MAIQSISPPIEDVKNGIRLAVEKYGGIQGLINCAGVGYARKVHPVPIRLASH
jgi:NAD(P)-dependent dehydrogenase (short-subunit alcohol dehydrogenase family)